jgi:TonB family protein
MLVSTVCTASVRHNALRPERDLLSTGERQIFRPAVRDARFQDIPHTSARSRCEDTEPPQALATPSPLLVALEEPAVTVSFIVGTDGKVHSPLILLGDDPRGNRLVLDAVRHWRYRPATCNGVPTEVEGKVQFSRR